MDPGSGAAELAEHLLEDHAGVASLREGLVGGADAVEQDVLGEGVEVLGHDVVAAVDERAGARGLDERDARARSLVDGACDIGKLMETLAAREAGRPEPHPGWQPSLNIGGGRLAIPIAGGVLEEAQRADGIPIGEPLRQPRVRDRGTEGEGTLLDEHFGPDFVLVGRTEADLSLDPEASAIAERIGLRGVALDGLETVEGEFDRVFQRVPAALLRPDRYVFGVVDDTTDASTLVRTLAAKLRLSKESR